MIARLPLAARLSIVVVLGFLTIMLAVFSVVYITMLNQARDLALVKLETDLATTYEILEKEVPGDWRPMGTVLYKGDTPITTNTANAIVDRLGDLTGGNAITIFHGSAAITTNVRINNNRTMGDRVPDEVIETVLGRGEQYFGTSMIRGIRYQSAYMPMLDENGRVFGMWFIGVPEDVATETVLGAFVGITAISLVGLVIVLIVLRLTISRIVFKPLKTLAAQAGTMSKGDFSNENNISVITNDAIGLLVRSLSEMQSKIASLIGKVKGNAQELNEASKQLAVSITQNNRAVDDVAETANKFSLMVKNINSSAQGMVVSAEKVSSMASEGEGAITRAVNQTNELKNEMVNMADMVSQLGRKSQAVGKIIDVITGIAEQTNLLALNAAIEAARVGEHGRGFTIVAEEISKLASQSAKSAAEIQAVISEMQSETTTVVDNMKMRARSAEEGASTVKDSGRLLGEILVSVGEITGKISEISAAVASIDDGSQQIAGVTEEHAATSQEITASAESLREMATHLSEMVSTFTIKNDK